MTLPDTTRALQAEIEALRQRLAQIETSTAWRVISRVTRFVDRWPVLRLVGWAVTGQFGRIRAHRAARRLVRALLRFGLFDAAFYRTQRPDLAGPGVDLLLHYVTRGQGEGLRPNPLFDPRYYAATAGVSVSQAIGHYLAHGIGRGLSPHPLFDPAHYAAQCPEAAANPLGHYLAGRSHDPNPDFDTAWYRRRYRIGRANPLVHFVQTGQALETNGRRIEALQAGQGRALGRDLPPGRVAVGIVTYDTPPEMLARVLRSVAVSAQEVRIDPVVLLIDNGGPSSEALREQAGLRILPSAGNVGFGGGHNRLMRAAFDEGAAHYLALNPDAALHPAALGALLRMSQAAGGLALVQGLQFPAEQAIAYDPATFEAPWISGACMLIPRPVYERIGGFDDGFFLYCEDVDYSWRARAARLRTLTCPTALVFHPTTNRVLDPRTQAMFLESAYRLATKWRSPAFIARVRSELLPRGLPEPDLSDVEAELDTAVADFEHGFFFAPVRW